MRKHVPGVLVLGLLMPSVVFAVDDARVDGLVQDLLSPDAAVQQKAREELSRTGPAAVPTLVAAAAGRNIVLAGEARQLLTALGPSAIDALIDVYQHDYNSPRPRLRQDEAIAAVARMGEVALPRMLEIFTTSEPFGDWSFAEGVLAQMHGLSVGPLIPLMKHPRKEVRAAASAILTNFNSSDPRTFDASMEGLKSEDGDVQMNSAMGLARIGDHRAADALLGALHASFWGARRACVDALGAMYEPRFRTPLVLMARHDPFILVREKAAKVLIEDSGDPVAIRLGWRYRPMDIGPAGQVAVQITYALFFGVTALVFIVIGVSGAYATNKGGVWSPRVAAMIVAGLAGLAWGRLLLRMTVEVEYGLLLAFVPLLAVFGLAVGSLSLYRKPSARRCGLLWLLTIVAFYLGYGVGWLMLWGYLGF